MPGKPAPLPTIDAAPRGARDMGRELRAIEDVAPPRIGERGGADQIDRGLPAAQQIEVDAQALQRFT